MLKFIRHHMETIVGIEIFPLISFVIFFVFFIGLFVYVLRANKTELNQHSQLPLDAKEETNAQI